jgi:hypothetical protein
MFFRFGIVVVALVAISLGGVAIEKQSLVLRRSIVLQDYRLHQLLEQRARLRLRVETLSAANPGATDPAESPESDARRRSDIAAVPAPSGR